MFVHVNACSCIITYDRMNTCSRILLIISVDVISPVLDIDISIYHSVSFISLVLYLYHSPLVNVHKSKNLLGDG